ncbi:septum formation family protein [Haematomicrobium sanguinis]|uniref:septum formation family protein n=1 Tax=Haematomicrobium sanguinis TaxID=479106 RepID=UPI00146FA31C|nr:septum formation family protein [Haematomicrobium sanguinis]
MAHSVARNVRHSCGVALAALALVLGLTGCSIFGGGGDAARDESGKATEAATGATVFSLKTGDCTNDLTGTEITNTDIIPCEQPHTLEVYADMEVTSATYPPSGDLEQQADDFCIAQLNEFYGADYESQNLESGGPFVEYTYLYPTQSTWDQADDRLIQCLIGEVDLEKSTSTAVFKEVTGSLKGKGSGA